MTYSEAERRAAERLGIDVEYLREVSDVYLDCIEEVIREMREKL